MGSPYFHKIKRQTYQEPSEEEKARLHEAAVKREAEAKAARQRLIDERHERERLAREGPPTKKREERKEEQPLHAIVPPVIGGSHVPDIEKRVVGAANAADSELQAIRQENKEKGITGLEERAAKSVQGEKKHAFQEPDIAEHSLTRFIHGMFKPGTARDIVDDWDRQGKKIRFFRQQNQWHMQVDDRTIAVDDFNRRVAQEQDSLNKQIADIKQMVNGDVESL